MTKTSVKGIARQAQAQDSRTRAAIGMAISKATAGQPLAQGATLDSFVNLAHKLGLGADNALSSGTYGYNPITRNRNLLEWIHRGSWLGGCAIDIVANDMTRAGIDYANEMDPDDQQDIDGLATQLAIWDKFNEGVKWGRLYGGAIVVAMIDGQDMRTPLRLESVGQDQFKGLYALDRWFVEPSLEDLVTEMGPDMGKPKYYRVQLNAPALRGMAIHHSRVMLRHVGVELPYQQSLTENLWGVSVLERLYDRMIGFDSASTGIAQLVFKSFLRTLKVKDLRQVVAAGGKAMDGLQSYAEIMRRYQGIEGMTMIDGEDELEVQQTSAFSGVAGAIDKLGEQVAGALQMPLTRLFGQAPGGLNADGDSHLRNYYDSIKQQQQKLMYVGVSTVYKLMAQSLGKKLPDDFAIDFASLWELDNKEKADVADKVGTAVDRAFDKGLIGRKTALMELRQASRYTGVFSNITREAIDEADDEVLPPSAELAMGQEHEMDKLQAGQEHDMAKTKMGHEHAEKLAKQKEKANAGQNRKAGKVGGGQGRRKLL